MQLPGWLCCTWLLLLPISCKSPGSKRVPTWNTHLLFWWTFVHHTLPLFSWTGLWASNKHHDRYGNPVLGHKNLMISRFPVCNVGFDNLLPETGIPHWCRLPFKASNSNPSSKVECLNKQLLTHKTKSIWVGMIEPYWTTRSLPKKHLKVRIHIKWHQTNHSWPGMQSLKPVAIDELWSSCLQMHYLRCPRKTPNKKTIHVWWEAGSEAAQGTFITDSGPPTHTTLSIFNTCKTDRGQSGQPTFGDGSFPKQVSHFVHSSHDDYLKVQSTSSEVGDTLGCFSFQTLAAECCQYLVFWFRSHCMDCAKCYTLQCRDGCFLCFTLPNTTGASKNS